ncbi:WhiB family transcriptional regulator [Nonomuraea terrae]|uniref:WhiB family transcriptional regulator n=1 Tax=Nonomuraea terrae TaxID=2530383 RepID=A0A4V2YL82_9ACTN|nr:WhiB family transcriptional regulator [Nonomuraea terrae]TDD45417.1 WhiB family transcriptional regulator [Nonomuraea terrae]
MSQPNWEPNAACHAYPAEVFFPIAYHPHRRDVQAAKRICAACPVQAECLAWALANPYRSSDGIWGGTTPPERASTRRARTAERTAAA